MNMLQPKAWALAVGVMMASAAAGDVATAAEVKVLTAGAMKEVVLTIKGDFERETGDQLVIENDTAGALLRRISGGEAFDVAIVTPAIITELTSKGKVAAGTARSLARVGIGVMVKAGAPAPDISSVDAVKRALLEAKSIAMIDPSGGGSSGIYLAALFDKWGLSQQLMAKAKLKRGGYVADIIAAGEAELGLHQISEILPVAGVTLVGPLPAEIQSYTTYNAGISAAAANAAGARVVIRLLTEAKMDAVLQAKGMQRPPP
jgi:molybdate transport system substrate-binding protein